MREAQTVKIGSTIYFDGSTDKIDINNEINIKKYPERTKEKELGLLAKQKLKEWLVGDITLKSYGTDKYGRVLGDIFCDKGNIAELLEKENLAVPYYGGTKTKIWGK